MNKSHPVESGGGGGDYKSYPGVEGRGGGVALGEGWEASLGRKGVRYTAALGDVA